MFYKRDLAKILPEFTKFPVVAFIGPRQSGKTTLAQNYFKNHAYFCLEDPEIRSWAENDPKSFLQDNANEHGIVIDEFQYVPHLLSYIQLEVDAKQKPGYFILTGSQNFLVNKKINQSLAGRIGIITLLPFSISELTANKLAGDNVDNLMLSGSYPRLFTMDIKPPIFYQGYIRTYLQRDVRDMVSVKNLRTFQKFMGLCAGRIGQQLNIADLATNCGIDRSTVDSWLSILEASFIIFFLKPYFDNFNKRLTKSPKLYFYDTGLACSLLGIKTKKQLSLTPFRGPLFECIIIADLHKQYYNTGDTPSLYYWRDTNGRIEVDCIIDAAGNLTPIEIKASKTMSGDFFNQLKSWNNVTNTDPASNYVIYGGEIAQKRSGGKAIGWQKASTLITTIENQD